MDHMPIDNPDIVVTAARAPEPAADSAASVTIIDRKRIERLGEPLVPALLRLVPSTAVAASGPAGSLAEVRIRGAEAYHTLLFIDGIRANDPAAGNAPRFELLNADLVSRIEVVRGPQSALWGSEAIGGVIAVDGDPGETPSLSAATEAGSFGFRRATASASATPGPPSSRRLSAGSGRAESTFSAAAIATDIATCRGGCERAGPVAVPRNWHLRVYPDWAQRVRRQRSVHFPAGARPGQHQPAGAGQIWVHAGASESAWKGQLSASLLGSKKNNFFEGEPINQTWGGRTTLSGQVERRFSTGAIEHQLIGAIDHEKERFKARDTVFRRLHGAGPDPAASIADGRMAGQGGTGGRRRRGSA